MEEIEFKFHHIGMNTDSRETAVQIVRELSRIFHLAEHIDKPGSPFAGEHIEVIAGNGPGIHGHIAFVVENMDKAVQYLEDRNIEINYETAKKNVDGSVYVIYLKEQIAGYAIQLFCK